jgi:hypothetical protein
VITNFISAIRKKESEQTGKTGSITAADNNGAHEYKKLFKHFGPDRKNKDLRIQMNDKINEEITTKLGPLMQLNINPAYQIEQRMDLTNFRETYKGEKVEATDKVYFRKKDDMIEYAECLFKSKVLMTKK